jgi:hypothetical protein
MCVLACAKYPLRYPQITHNFRVNLGQPYYFGIKWPSVNFNDLKDVSLGTGGEGEITLILSFVHLSFLLYTTFCYLKVKI